MRGDHCSRARSTITAMGTSPHARGPLLRSLRDGHHHGNIPACAGTTCCSLSTSRRCWEHPRMRGDHLVDLKLTEFEPGTSPHARGPLSRIRARQRRAGNIPACAGTTGSIGIPINSRGEHPRMRGDHPITVRSTVEPTGTSPHARGPLIVWVIFRRCAGNIPACAGTTLSAASFAAYDREHPRMRGDHPFTSASCRGRLGTSPHARGPRLRSRNEIRLRGNIPACAGTTSRA